VPEAPDPAAAAFDELVSIIASHKEPGFLDRLRKFVEEHPGDAEARGYLALRLIVDRPKDGPWDDGEARELLERLRADLPGEGLPDLLLARLEGIAGRTDECRRLLVEGARKGIEWIPDGRILRGLIERDLEKGLPFLEVLNRAGSLPLLPCAELRFLSAGTIRDAEGKPLPVPPAGDPEGDAIRASARAILGVGKGFEDSGQTLIHELVGAAMVESAAEVLEKAGDLLPEEAALRQEREAIRRDCKIATDVIPEILASDREAAREFLRDFASLGERTAARRATMAYLARRLSE